MKSPTYRRLLPALALTLAAGLPLVACDEGGEADVTADATSDVADTGPDTIQPPACAARDPLEPFQIEILVDGETIYGIRVTATETVIAGAAEVTKAPSGAIGDAEMVLQADQRKLTIATNLPSGDALLVKVGQVVDVKITITQAFAREIAVVIRDPKGELLLDYYDGHLGDTPVRDPCGPIPDSCGAISLMTMDVLVDTPALPSGGNTVALSEAESAALSGGGKSFLAMVRTLYRYDTIRCTDIPSGYLERATLQVPVN